MPGTALAIGRKLAVWSRPVHVSWLLAWFSMALIGGIALSLITLSPQTASWRIAVAGMLLLAVVLAKRPAPMIMVILAVAAGLLIGMFRGEGARLGIAGYQIFFGQTVRLNGTISDDLVIKGGATDLKLQAVQLGQRRLGGKVWASTSTGLHLRRGDRVTLSGKLRSGFGSYAASMSFAKLTASERQPHSDPTREARDAFDGGLEKTVPQPEAALAIGYLTGQHNLMPDRLIKQMQLTGLIHLVIAGGYNVTILVRLVRRACKKLAKRLAVLASAAVLVGLTLVSGFVAPMARTSVVTGLSLVAWYCGRWPHPLVLLPVAAALTALMDPSFVWGDVGWYMTFIAYGGLIVLGPLLKRWWWGDRHSGEIKQIIVDTIAVQIVTTPLMAFAFQQYSVYGLPANLMVLPFMSLTMLSATAAGLAGMTLPIAIARWASWPANLLLGYTHKITTWLASAPGADIGAGLSLSGLVLSYVLIGLFIWRLKHRTGYDFRTENPVE